MEVFVSNKWRFQLSEARSRNGEVFAVTISRPQEKYKHLIWIRVDVIFPRTKQLTESITM